MGAGGHENGDDPQFHAVLRAAFPGEDHRFFLAMTIGSEPGDGDAGAALILGGTKTATSSPPWDYPDGRIPFAGALSVLLDGRRRPRGVVETIRVETLRFGDADEAFARAYGEGERSLAWWRREIGAWYRASAARHGVAFSDDTAIIAEWIAVVRRL